MPLNELSHKEGPESWQSKEIHHRMNLLRLWAVRESLPKMSHSDWSIPADQPSLHQNICPTTVRKGTEPVHRNRGILDDEAHGCFLEKSSQRSCFETQPIREVTRWQRTEYAWEAWRWRSREISAKMCVGNGRWLGGYGRSCSDDMLKAWTERV